MEFGFFNMDCMDGMKNLPDKSIDLAITDPPYGDAKLSDNSGGGIGNGSAGGSTATGIHHQKKNVRQPDGTWGVANWRRLGEEVRSDKKIIAWDVAPGKEYFNELFRVSRNQIIWGGELLPTAGDEVLFGLGENQHSRSIHDGYV